jgi:hypothetical protein
MLTLLTNTSRKQKHFEIHSTDVMSALGQERTSPAYSAMSALPPKADKLQRFRDVRFVPKADISLTSSIARGWLRKRT